MKLSRGFKRTVAYAVYDCAARGKSSLSADHLLLGLFREDFPLIDDITNTFSLDSFKLLDTVLGENPETFESTRADHVSLGPEALEILQYAELEAYGFAHESIRPEHLFLGIMDSRASMLNDFLMQKEVVCALVRELVAVTRFGETGTSERHIYELDPLTRMEIQHINFNSPIFHNNDLSISILQLFKGYF